MKKDQTLLRGTILVAVLSIGALGLSLPVSAADLPPAETVLAKYAEAIGGEALDKVENRASEFKFEMPMQGVYTTGVEYWVKPAQFYLRIELASMGVSDYEAGVTDGVSWESHPMNGTRQRTGDEARVSLRQASLNPFADWKSHFEKAETVGEETVGDKACYKVAFTPAEGMALNAFFDEDSGLLLRQEMVSSTGARIVTTLSDYEETRGITSARTLQQKGADSFTVTYTSVAYDVEEIPEGTFELPASVKASLAE